MLWRPRTLKSFYGQPRAVAHVRGFLKQGECPQAILISGPTGSGKTTLAKIIASSINEGDLSCVEEINVADQRKIEDIRAIEEKTKFKPSSAYRVFILDEAHCLTAGSASVLLKPLEESNHRIVFILCSNEPEKILQTIRDRCTTVHLTVVSDEDLTGLLTGVVKKFPKYEEAWLKNQAAIIKSSFGTPRRALQLLQEAYYIGVGGGTFKETVQKEGGFLKLLKVKDRALIQEIVNLMQWMPYQKITGEIDASLEFLQSLMLQGKFNSQIFNLYRTLATIKSKILEGKPLIKEWIVAELLENLCCS